ncbi:MAG: ester cyclase [Trueperaceae bacterium]
MTFAIESATAMPGFTFVERTETRSEGTMHTLESIATSFHHACMTGEGWQACQPYCAPDATFVHEGTMFADAGTLEAYVAFIQSAITPVPDFQHEVLSVGIDERQQRVLIHYLIRGTHTGEGLPVPPTGKSLQSHCVLILYFENELISHATKVWNDHEMMKQLGWV